MSLLAKSTNYLWLGIAPEKVYKHMYDYGDLFAEAKIVAPDAIGFVFYLNQKELIYHLNERNIGQKSPELITVHVKAVYDQNRWQSIIDSAHEIKNIYNFMARFYS